MNDPDLDQDAQERRLLALLRDGASAAEAADEADVPLVEVAQRLVAVRRRLGVSSTAEAVARVVGDHRRT